MSEQQQITPVERLDCIRAAISKAGGNFISIQEAIPPGPWKVAFAVGDYVLSIDIEPFEVALPTLATKVYERAIWQMKLGKLSSTTTEKKMTLIEKLHQIYSEVDAIEKAGHNNSQNYDYIRAADVTRKIREQFIALKIYAEINYEFIGLPYTIARAKEPNAPFTARDCRCSAIFHDLESTQMATGSGLGTGADTGDKAIYKAQTGALKYALKNSFLIPDVDGDPEADEKVDEMPDFSEVRRGPAQTRQNAKASEKKPATAKTETKATPATDPAAAPRSASVAAAPAANPTPAPATSQAKTSAKPAEASSTKTESAPAATTTSTPLSPAASAAQEQQALEDGNRPPTDAELTNFRVLFAKLGDDLADPNGGKLKSSKQLPINRKILVFMLKTENAPDPQHLTFGQWRDFFYRVDKFKASEAGLAGLSVLVDKANGIEPKK